MNKQFSQGFTFIETMIVLLTLGIMLMIGFPSLSGSSQDARLSGAVSEIVTAIEFAQMTAMNSGCKTKVTIDDTNDSILVERFKPDTDLLGTETELNQDDVEGGGFYTMGHPLNIGMDYHITLPDEGRFNSVDIVSSVFGSGDYVIFEASGAPSSGGTITITCGNIQKVLNIDSLNGKITFG